MLFSRSSRLPKERYHEGGNEKVERRKLKEILPLLAFRLFAFAFSLSTFAFPRLWRAAGRGVKASSVRQPEICEKQARGACVHSARNEEQDRFISRLPPSPTGCPCWKGLRRTGKPLAHSEKLTLLLFSPLRSLRPVDFDRTVMHFIISSTA